MSTPPLAAIISPDAAARLLRTRYGHEARVARALSGVVDGGFTPMRPSRVAPRQDPERDRRGQSSRAT